MSLCSACQGLLSRIILYQLGRVSNVPNVYGDAFGDGQRWKSKTHCLICRVFTTHLSDKTKLEIRRCDESRLNAKDESTSVHVALGDGPVDEVGLTVDLMNAADLLETWEQRFGGGELSIHGPVLTHPRLIDHAEKYEAISKASSWLRGCDSRHDRCKVTPSTGIFMPRRVLDISRTDKCEDVRLISGSGVDDRYAALSYCWGIKSLLTTTTANLDEHKRGIPLTLLSPLIQDAVHIARELGLGYLWVDALCILQDDIDEWQSVASEVGTIFRNAYVTLAATGAEDSSQGMYPRTMKAELKFQTPKTTNGTEAKSNDAVEISSTWLFSLHKRPSPVRDILQSPLNKRGWVLQELMLSQRTLYFAKDQIFWHCKELAASADGVFSNSQGVMSDLGWYYGPDVVVESMKPRKPKETIRDFQVRRWRPGIVDDDEEICIEKVWWRLVEDYSARKLTLLSDKLIALSGIVHLVQKMRPDIYFVGMWEQDLPEALLWYNDGSESEGAIVSGIPSWSWASIDCPVRMPRLYRSGGFTPLIKVIEIGVNSTINPIVHQVSTGTLRLTGDLITLEFDDFTTGEKSIFIKLFRITSKDGKSSRTYEGSGTLDTEHRDVGISGQILGLPIGTRHDEVYVLLLRKIDGHVDTFQRLGTGSLSTANMDMEYFETKQASKQTINLI